MPNGYLMVLMGGFLRLCTFRVPAYLSALYITEFLSQQMAELTGLYAIMDLLRRTFIHLENWERLFLQAHMVAVFLNQPTRGQPGYQVMED